MSQLDSGTFQQVKDPSFWLSPERYSGLACPTALLPAGTGVESLERFALERFRFRGVMTTTSIEDFVRYSKGYASATEKSTLLYRRRPYDSSLSFQYWYAG